MKYSTKSASVVVSSAALLLAVTPFAAQAHGEDLAPLTTHGLSLIHISEPTRPAA